MGQQINTLGKNTCYHGNAGIASAFAALAHRKLKPGGVLALVLPLTAASGLSWQKFRTMLATEYRDVTVFSIAAAGDTEMAFSSDTGMAECLVIARRGSDSNTQNLFVSLDHRPASQVYAHVLAAQTVSTDHVRRIEDGPYGGTPLYLGNDSSAETILAKPKRRGAWGPVRLADQTIAQAAHALTNSQLWLHGSQAPMQLAIRQVGSFVQLGKVDRDIVGPPPRGPFTKHPPNAHANYPSLWNHNHYNERRIVCLPDSQLRVNVTMEEKAAIQWMTASRCHLNRDFTFGAQALAIAFTDRPSIGGRVWPNVLFNDQRFDYAFAIWGNSTLGLVSYWWHSSRQQSSKASMTIRSAEALPILDFRELSDDQLRITEDIFEDFRERDLQPAYLADADPNRARLDHRVVCELLGFDQSVYEGVRRLAAKWCAEPSVHGGKAHPPDARLVI